MMTTFRPSPLRLLRTLWCVAAICALAAASFAAVSSRHAAAAGRWTAFVSPPASAAVPPGRSIYTLGDAARPFAWSTVIADFNTDGRADVAVANHIASSSGVYAYRIDFSIAGEEPNGVTFESTREA